MQVHPELTTTQPGRRGNVLFYYDPGQENLKE